MTQKEVRQMMRDCKAENPDFGVDTFVIYINIRYWLFLDGCKKATAVHVVATEQALA